MLLRMSARWSLTPSNGRPPVASRIQDSAGEAALARRRFSLPGRQPAALAASSWRFRTVWIEFSTSWIEFSTSSISRSAHGNLGIAALSAGHGPAPTEPVLHLKAGLLEQCSQLVAVLQVVHTHSVAAHVQKFVLKDRPISLAVSDEPILVKPILRMLAAWLNRSADEHGGSVYLHVVLQLRLIASCSDACSTIP
jgi:hypothetical protein